MRIYNRSAKLVVYTTDGSKTQVVDLSELDFDYTVTAKAPYRKDGKNHTTPIKAEVNVYKLNVQTRDKLIAEAAGIELQAGYDGETSVIFSGTIVNILPDYQAPDWVITLIATDGWAEYNNSFFSRSYAADTPVASILKDVAGSFAIPVVDRSGLSASLLTGTVFDGKSKMLMDRLARDYDLNWSIENNSITITDALNPPLVDRAQAVILSDDLLNGPIIEETTEGNKPANKKVVRRIRAVAMLNAGLFPGVPVQFKAKSFERSFSDADKEKVKSVDENSYFVCDEVTHRGSNWSPQNSTEVLTREENAQ